MTNNLELAVALHDAVGGMSDKDDNAIHQLQEIASFFENMPDSVDMLRRVAGSNKNPNIKNLEHLTAFVLLNKKKLGILDSLDDINNQLKYYG